MNMSRITFTTRTKIFKLFTRVTNKEVKDEQILIIITEDDFIQNKFHYTHLLRNQIFLNIQIYPKQILICQKKIYKFRY